MSKTSASPLPVEILDTLFDNAPEFMVVLDSELNVNRAGTAFRDAVGMKKTGTVSFLDTVERFSLSRVRDVFEKLRGGKTRRRILDINHRRPEGGSIRVRYSWVACLDEPRTRRTFVGIGREVQGEEMPQELERLKSELQAATGDLERRTKEIARLRKEMKRQAVRDDLTSLGNRRFLMERLEVEAARSIRYDQPLTLVLLDVDRMTHINDTHGRDKGDEVIQQVAAVVQDQIRQTDIAGRYAGEEFMVLCPHTDRASAQFLAERLRRRVAELSFNGEEEEFGATVSVGLVTVTGQNEFDVEAILRAAEEALESAKTGGMNRVRVLEVI
jgi:diguanylate cyclase (GGDEF)-like protein